MFAITYFVSTINKTVSNDAETIRPYYLCSNIVNSLSCLKKVILFSRNGLYLRFDSK